MVRLVVTDHLKTSLDALGDLKRDGAQLPLELLEAIQQQLEGKQAWVEHKLLARISKWNKTTPSQFTLMTTLIARSNHFAFRSTSVQIHIARAYTRQRSIP